MYISCVFCNRNMALAQSIGGDQKQILSKWDEKARGRTSVISIENGYGALFSPIRVKWIPSLNYIKKSNRSHSWEKNVPKNWIPSLFEKILTVDLTSDNVFGDASLLVDIALQAVRINLQRWAMPIAMISKAPSGLGLHSNILFLAHGRCPSLSEFTPSGLLTNHPFPEGPKFIVIHIPTLLLRLKLKIPFYWGNFNQSIESQETTVNANTIDKKKLKLI